MTHAVASDFKTTIARRVEAAAHQTLAARWLEELKRLFPVAPDDIFPGGRIGVVRRGRLCRCAEG
jgi:hypothetical protein